MDPIAALCAALFRQGVYVTPDRLAEAVDVAGITLTVGRDNAVTPHLTVITWPGERRPNA